MNALSAPVDFGALTQSYLAANPIAQSAPSAGDGAINLVVGTAEIAGAGMLMAYLNGRSPAEDKTYHEMFGYPTDVVLGLGGVSLGIILALFGSKAYGHILRVGLGCLIEAGVRMGLEKGVVDRSAEKEKAALTGDKAKLRLVGAPAIRQAFAHGSAPSVEIARTDAPRTGDVFQPVNR